MDLAGAESTAREGIGERAEGPEGSVLSDSVTLTAELDLSPSCEYIRR